MLAGKLRPLVERQHALCPLTLALRQKILRGSPLFSLPSAAHLLPLLAKKLGFDPAVMASPFITTIVDALSLLVYFLFAKTILGL